MSLNLATLNARGLRDPSKYVRLLGELSDLSVNAAAVQETHFICDADCWVLERDFVVFSAYGRCSGAGVSLLVGCSLNADVNIVFAGDGGWLVVANVAIKSFEFRMIAVYAYNIVVERASFYRWLLPFFNNRKQLDLVGDWNAILHPKIDQILRCESSLIGLKAWHDLVNSFHLDHPQREMWMWLDSSPSTWVGSYLDSVLEELTVISLVIPCSTL